MAEMLSVLPDVHQSKVTSKAGIHSFRSVAAIVDVDTNENSYLRPALVKKKKKRASRVCIVHMNSGAFYRLSV